MDSIYIISKNKKHTEYELLNTFLGTIIKYRYYLSIASYNDERSLPLFKVERKDLYLNEEGIEVLPTIWVNFLNIQNLYKSDNNFPILFNGDYYYPIISFQCRDSLFLLELLIQIVKSDMNFLVCNAENNLLGIDELEIAFKDKNYGWGYQD